MSLPAPGEYTVPELERMIAAYEAMARGVYSERAWERDHCLHHADYCRDLIVREPARLDMLAHEAERAQR